MKTRLKRLITFTGDYQNKEEIILRDHLAMERTKLANERTLLSYVRTSLYLFLGGIGILGLKDFEDLKILGYISLTFSLTTLIIGFLRFFQLKKHLRKVYIPVKKKEGED